MPPFASLRVTLRRAVRRLKSFLGLDVYRRAELAVETVLLGDSGGRWSVVPDGLGPHTVVYALGVGTDISFERDLIARYGVTVHAFDPTPISLEWAASRIGGSAGLAWATKSEAAQANASIQVAKGQARE